MEFHTAKLTTRHLLALQGKTKLFLCLVLIGKFVSLL